MIKPLNKGDIITTPFVVSNTVVAYSKRNECNIILETDIEYTTAFKYEDGTYIYRPTEVYFLSEDGDNYLTPEHYLSEVNRESPILTLDFIDYGDGEWTQITTPITHVTETDDTEISNNVRNGVPVVK